MPGMPRLPPACCPAACIHTYTPPACAIRQFGARCVCMYVCMECSPTSACNIDNARSDQSPHIARGLTHAHNMGMSTARLTPPHRLVRAVHPPAPSPAPGAREPSLCHRRHAHSGVGPLHAGAAVSMHLVHAGAVALHAPPLHAGVAMRVHPLHAGAAVSMHLVHAAVHAANGRLHAGPPRPASAPARR